MGNPATPINSFDRLPFNLTIKEASVILWCSLQKTYELANRQDFPAIRLGRHIVIPRDKLFQWMEREADKEN